MSISAHLNEHYDADAIPGKKIECVFCGKGTLQINREDTLAKCFHPACERFINLNQIKESYTGSSHELLDQICVDFHRALLEQQGPQAQSVYNYLTEERGIHETVIKDSMIGVVPDKYDVQESIKELIKGLEEKKNRANEKDKNIIDDEISKIANAGDKLQEIIDYKKGWLCFFYTDPFLRITGIRLRKPYARKMAFYRLYNDDNGVFGLGLFGMDNNDDEEQLIVLEGEFDLLQLQSLYINSSEDNNIVYANAVSIGGASNPDFKAIKELSSHPILIHDNDDAGFAVVENARDLMHLDAVKAPNPFKDLDAFLIRFGDDYCRAREEFEKMLSKRVTLYRDYESLEEEINNIRKRKIKEAIFNRLVTEIVLPDLYHRGKFYIHGNEGYYFIKEDKKLIRISKFDYDFILLLSYYGINKSEGTFKYLLSEIDNECYKNGTRSNVHRFAFYNKETNTLYVNNNDSLIYKISKEKIEAVDNGTDGVLFVNKNSWEPFQMVNIDHSHSYVRELIVDKINFDTDGRMTLEEYRYLFEIWFYSLFFESIMPTKPVIAFIGAKGSGKSITMRKVGKLFFGNRFDVTPLQKDPKDFDVTAANSYFLAIDNADTKSDWLEDRIATISTGGSIKVRTLYTNNDLMEIETRCFLAITSRTPYFRRDDIADRLLIIKVGEINEFLPEQELLDEVINNRDVIMTEIIYRLQDILKSIGEGETEKMSLRMADFASIAYMIGRADNKLCEVRAILKKIEYDQTLFTLERDPLVDLIHLWLEQGNEGEFVDNKKLFNDLKRISNTFDENFSYSSHRSFAQKMTNLRRSLEKFFNIEEMKIGGNIKLYSYRSKPIRKLMEEDFNEKDEETSFLTDETDEEVENELF